jgi:hypothetical protein
VTETSVLPVAAPHPDAIVLTYNYTLFAYVLQALMYYMGFKRKLVSDS